MTECRLVKRHVAQTTFDQLLREVHSALPYDVKRGHVLTKLKKLTF